MVVARGGRLVFDRYYEGYDQRWGERLGTIKFGPSIKHDLRSISKNVVGLLYGIAMSQRKVPMFGPAAPGPVPEIRRPLC